MKKTWICLLLAMLMALPCIAVAEEAVLTEPVDAAVADAGDVALELPEYEFDAPYAGEGDIDGEAGYVEAAEGVAVPPNAVAIDLSQGNEFYVGFPTQLNVVLDPVDAQTTLTWKSSKKKVAKVSATGLLTPLRAGKTKITVKTANKKKSTAAVTVKKNLLTMNPMPTRAQIRSYKNHWFMYGKSIERDAWGNYTLKLVLINGLGRSKFIKNLGLQLSIGGDVIAQKTWKKIRISCGKNSAKVFKLKFKANELVNLNPYLLPNYAGKISIRLITNPSITYIK